MTAPTLWIVSCREPLEENDDGDRHVATWRFATMATSARSAVERVKVTDPHAGAWSAVEAPAELVVPLGYVRSYALAKDLRARKVATSSAYGKGSLEKREGEKKDRGE